jgi:hypothetical protein
MYSDDTQRGQKREVGLGSGALGRALQSKDLKGFRRERGC